MMGRIDVVELKKEEGRTVKSENIRVSVKGGGFRKSS